MALLIIDLTRERVRELFFYEPSMGWLIRRCSVGNSKKGSIAGTTKPSGYLDVKVDGRIYKGHRVVWLYHFGELPPMLDHKDRIPANIRIENLRPATRSQNMANRNANKNSMHKYKGVRKRARGGWQARIRIDGKDVHLGSYSTEEEARKAYVNKGKEVHGEYFNP